MMQLIGKRPVATAKLAGNRNNSGLKGTVRFYQMPGAVLIEADVFGMPNNDTGFFGFHIHEGSSCSGMDFSGTGGHFGEKTKPHPKHAGDLPPLLNRNGRAYLAVMTDRFSVADILDRTVVIHAEPDDFQSQPSGNAGEKIACGRISKA